MSSLNEKTQKILDEIIQREGGYTNHPNDRGGPTNMGITQKTLSGWYGRPATINEVRNLTREAAEEIYIKTFLTNNRIDSLPEEIHDIMFDMSVNHGPKNAIIMLQKALCNMGFITAIDGLIGPKTREMTKNAIEQRGEAELQNRINSERVMYFHLIVRRDPSQKIFLKGWLNRADQFWLKNANGEYPGRNEYVG